MSRRRKNICRRYRCESSLYAAGLCLTHYDEETKNSERREHVQRCLHGREFVTARTAGGDALLKEFEALRSRWWDSCQAVQTGRDYKYVPADEAEHALSWCESLGIELLEAIEACEQGRAPSAKLDWTRGWVDERFANLEKGMTSNGRARDTAGISN